LRLGRVGRTEEVNELDNECAYSFDDLFRAAKGRLMSEEERNSLEAAPQDDRNRRVREWAAETGGEFVCEDRSGTDGRIYTAFWVVDERVADGRQ
jgi:hypothetical protein